MFNHPIVQNNSSEIKRCFSRDFNLNLSWLTFKNKWGWQIKAGGGTQSVCYKRRTKTGAYETSNSYIGGDGNYTFNINKTYNFNLTKNINFLSALGPVLFLNRYTNNKDSIRYAAYTDVTAYNTKPLGLGFYLGLNTVFKVSTRMKFVITTFYQRGFFKNREARISTPDGLSEVVFNYFGSGPGVSFGFMFCPKNKRSTVK